jgi:hypothetical protein
MRWEEACYVPTKSDAFVIAFRKWMKKYAGGGPDLGGGLPPTVSKEQLMDRWTDTIPQHISFFMQERWHFICLIECKSFS